MVFEGPDGIQVLPASSGVEELANLDEFRTECLIRSLSELENDVDIILIDSPSGIGRTGALFESRYRSTVGISGPTCGRRRSR